MKTIALPLQQRKCLARLLMRPNHSDAALIGEVKQKFDEKLSHQKGAKKDD